jgi:putative sugar O-methyltransferase
LIRFLTSVPGAPELQVAEDPPLVDLMLADLRAAPPIYHATSFWQHYLPGVLDTLREHGLTDFRRRRDSVIEAFGAVDIVRPVAELQPPTIRSRWLRNRFTGLLPGFGRLLDWMNRLSLRDASAAAGYYLSPEVIREIYVGYAAQAAGRARHARPLSAAGMSRLGNPEDVFSVGDHVYSMFFVWHYLRYAFVSRFLNFDAIRVFVELGSGNGKLVELVHKLHPKAAILVFDIPPQLYFANQYLLSVFPGEVAGYRETRSLSRLDPEPGRIYVMGNYQFPLIADLDIDLFWNTASIDEMEPAVVENYLRIVNACAKHVFLHEVMSGTVLARRAGDKGVMAQTTIEHYRRFLDGFRLVCAEPALPYPIYDDSFWGRA